ncbi:primosomal protein N' family DNA-binding protein [Persephonella sp.]
MSDPYKKDIYIDVALPVSQFMTFTYKIPNSKLDNIQYKELIGRRVLVPFKKKGFTGVITGINSNKKDITNIRNVISIPDPMPVFTEKYLNAIKKLSEYYVSPLGLTIHNLLPECFRWDFTGKKWNIKNLESCFFTLNPDLYSADLNLSEKEKRLFEIIKKEGELSYSEIKKHSFSNRIVKKLISEGLINIKCYSDINLENNDTPSRLTVLNNEKFLFSHLILKNRFIEYKRLFSKLLEDKGSALIIFPNLDSVNSASKVFKKLFPDKVITFSDQLDENNKGRIWFLLMKKSGFLIIGTPQTVFIPIKNLKLIIIEEEHSDSYRLLKTPRLDLRRAVFEIYRSESNFSVIYSSTIPSIESFYSYKKNILKPFYDIKKVTLPNCEINIKKFINLKESLSLIKEKILRKKTLILTNRKGYASFLYCDVCEEPLNCERCQQPLKIIKKSEEKILQCEACGRKYTFIDNCIRCDRKLREIGYGSEKVYEILTELTKSEDISFINDTSNTKIKIGTTIGDKEILYSDSYEIVVNIYPDIFLSAPDFKGREKFFRSIFQPLFLSKEEYIIFSNSDEQSVLNSLYKKDPNKFYHEELLLRKKYDLPPITRLILITFEKKGLTINQVEDIFKNWIKIENIQKLEYEGVFQALTFKIRERNRFQIVLKNFKDKDKLKTLYEISSKKGIKLIIEVDPKNIR